MKWLKAAGVGVLGSLVMFIMMMIGIHVTGIAPFNIPPSAAFLAKLGIPTEPLALFAHFGYGATWSVVLVLLFHENTSLGKGIGLSIVLWIFMMVVYSPIIGWGFFGFGGSNQSLSPDAQLYLESGPKYAIITLVLHLIYGTIIGWLNPVIIKSKNLMNEPAA